MNRANYFAKATKEDLELVKLFKEELSKLNLLYMRAIHSNDVTKANSILKKMGQITKTLEAEYWERATKRIPQEYLLGSKYIDDTLTKEASYIAINKASTKDLQNMLKELWQIHVDAVNALLNNSKNYVKSSLDGMERQALTMLNELQQSKVRETLARSTITGDSLQEMKDKVAKYFMDNQITVFKDRSGKSWSLDRYVDMLTRTETSIANIQGTINRAIQLGITKFRVVEQADCCELCSEYREEIVDITDGTVDLPPYHPNCRGYIVVVLDREEKETISQKLPDIEPIQEQVIGTENEEITEEEREALKYYVSGDGMDTNNILRGRYDGELTEQEKQYIDLLDNVTDKQISTDITELYRSVDINSFTNVTQGQFEDLQDYLIYDDQDKKDIADRIIGNITGREYTDKWFMSTTKDKEVALNWYDFTGSESPITVIFDEIQNARGIDLEELGIEKELNPDLEDSQAEVLIKRGAKFMANGVWVMEDSEGAKHIVIKASFIK